MTDPEMLRHLRWVLWASWGCLLCNLYVVYERCARGDWVAGGASFFVVVVVALSIRWLYLIKRRFER